MRHKVPHSTSKIIFPLPFREGQGEGEGLLM